VKPDNVPPALEAGDFPASYDHTGFRVPCSVVSAWSKKDHVSHKTFDHTSILKLVETKWNLPALTYRDANAHDMLDFFDLKATRPPFADPPVLAPPKNPFSSPAALPPSSISPADVALFHTTCTELPSGSLPPPGAKLSSPPARADALMAAQQARLQKEIRAQT
jgi:phospholipase C